MENETDTTNPIVILGGQRIGDCIMTIPAIRAIAEMHHARVDWIHGQYVRALFEVFEMSDLPLGSHLEVPEDRTPQDITDIEQWLQKSARHIVAKHKNRYVFSVDRWKTIGFQHQIYSWAQGLGVDPDRIRPPTLKLPDEYFAEEDYVVVQYDSVSKWKQMTVLKEIHWPLEAHCVGLPGEEIIPGTIDARTNDLRQIAKLIYRCRLFVGINSSLTQLAAALQKPTIMLHPHDTWAMSSGVEFPDRSNVDLVNPPKQGLEEAIQRMLNHGDTSNHITD